MNMVRIKCNMKKGQVTLFILVGIVLVIAVAVILTLKTKVSSEPNYEIATNFEAQKIQLASQIKTCIKIETKEAVDIYGLNGWSSAEEIEYYIENKLDDCIAFEDFERQGLNIKKEDIDATANVSGDYLFINVNYPMVLSNRMAESEIEDFIYSMEINKEKYIPTENGFVKEDTVIELKDAGIKIEISRGTEITKASTSRLSVETTGKDILQVYFDFNVANKIYNIGPDNAQLSKPAKITIDYDENMLPEGVTADDLSIVYYDEEQNRWVSVDTIIDKNNKVAVANVNHFSLYSLAWMMEQFDQDPQAFFGGNYVHDFCYDLKRDLDSKTEAFAFVLYYDDCSNSDTPTKCKSLYNKNVFSTSTAAAISAQSRKSTNVIVRAFSKNIGDYTTISAVGQRLFFDIFQRQRNFGWSWCHDNNISLGFTCLNEIESCIMGSKSCFGVISVSDIFSKCWEKANVYESDPNAIDAETTGIGAAECAEILPDGVICLEDTRCTRGDNRFGLEMCYEFNDPETGNPIDDWTIQRNLCPEGTRLTIGDCPDDGHVRCCVREVVLDFYEIDY